MKVQYVKDISGRYLVVSAILTDNKDELTGFHEVEDIEVDDFKKFFDSVVSENSILETWLYTID